MMLHGKSVELSFRVWMGYHSLLGGGFKHFFYFHLYLGKIPILTNIFRWVETTNQFMFNYAIMHGAPIILVLFFNLTG